MARNGSTPKRVVIAESFAESGTAVFERAGFVVDSCVGQGREALRTRIRDADALVVRSETRVDGDLLRDASQLAVVGRAGVGVDAIDVEAATAAGIVVLNTPSANTIAAAEHTFALLFAALRHIVPAMQAVRNGDWRRGPHVGSELYGKTLGIVGLGRIGTAVAERAKAFRVEALACDPFVAPLRAEELGATLVSLEELLQRCDIVTLHVPLTPQTTNLLNAKRLRMLKQGAILVNCSRGGVLDEDALVAMLDERHVAIAALDVLKEEPPEAKSSAARLAHHPSVVMTPHLGGSTHEALARIAIELAEDIVSVLGGRPAAGVINAPTPSGTDAALVQPLLDVAFRLGSAFAQLHRGDALPVLTLVLQGEISHVDPEPLSTALLCGLLQHVSERRISIANARAVAQELGIAVVTRSEEGNADYAASLRVASAGLSLSGAIVHRSPHIVGIDEYDIDLAAAGSLIITRHADVPGAVGRVGTALGKAAINISTMHVARDPSGLAMMVLSVDPLPSEATLAELRAIEGMRSVKAIVV